jgi:hypothetical protein
MEFYLKNVLFDKFLRFSCIMLTFLHIFVHVHSERVESNLIAGRMIIPENVIAMMRELLINMV